MSTKRIKRKLLDVVADVKLELESTFGITENDILAFRSRVDGNKHEFPSGSHMVQLSDLWIDYEVQRDVIPKHIISIMKNYDPRLCSPASACKVGKSKEILTYDGQHRTVATALLGFNTVPCNIVTTDDPAFPSYAFEQLNESGVKKLSPGDLHRNALTRYKLGSREEKNVRARVLQDQFDSAGIDLQDKGQRKSPTLRGDNDYFFSHFKYAYKGIDVDKSGGILYSIIDSIKTTYTLQEEIDQGVFIGLYELARLDTRDELPDNWMKDVLKHVKQTFTSSAIVHSKAKMQWAHVNPGATWSAPSAMANFMRELYLMNGGEYQLPYHGEGALMQVATNQAPGLIPKREAEVA